MVMCVSRRPPCQSTRTSERLGTGLDGDRGRLLKRVQFRISGVTGALVQDPRY